MLNKQRYQNDRFRVKRKTSSKKFRASIKSVGEWLNRRSQKRSYSWETFDKMFNYFKILKAKVYANIFDLKDEILYIL